MLNIQKIEYLYQTYYVKDDKVFLKDNHQEVTNEQLILEVKSSVLLYESALKRLQENRNQFGSRYHGTLESEFNFILKNYGLLEDKSTKGHGPKNVIEALLSSDGKYKLQIPGCQFEDKLIMFSPLKKDLGVSFLRLRAREKGFDIKDFQVWIDTTHFKPDGYSDFYFSFRKVPYLPLETVEDFERKFPVVRQLRDMENKRAAAKDKATADNIRNQMVALLRANPVELTAEEVSRCGKPFMERYFFIQMNKARLFNDETAYNYWLVNYQNDFSEIYIQKELPRLYGSLVLINKKLTEAIDLNDTTAINFYAQRVKDLLDKSEVFSFCQSPNVVLDNQTKEIFTKILMIKSVANNDKETFNYYKTVYQNLKPEEEPTRK